MIKVLEKESNSSQLLIEQQPVIKGKRAFYLIVLHLPRLFTYGYKQKPYNISSLSVFGTSASNKY